MIKVLIKHCGKKTLNQIQNLAKLMKSLEGVRQQPKLRIRAFLWTRELS